MRKSTKSIYDKPQTSRPFSRALSCTEDGGVQQDKDCKNIRLKSIGTGTDQTVGTDILLTDKSGSRALLLLF